MRTLICTLTLVVSSVAAEPKPPYSGTIFIAPDIITCKDPTSFQRLVKPGQGQRRMFDRRVNGWVNLNAHLFTAIFDQNEPQVEVQVNPEFDADAAFKEANMYLKVIGQLPTELRKDVKTVWIHKGKHGFGGGNNNLLIHTAMGEDYIAQGILAETFVHEATHTSLDAYHASNKQWLAAQARDPGFISEYAQRHPKREDLAESYLLYLAYRYKPDRIDDKTKRIIERIMPNRIAYLDSQKFKMHPVVKTGQKDLPSRPMVER